MQKRQHIGGYYSAERGIITRGSKLIRKLNYDGLEMELETKVEKDESEGSRMPMLPAANGTK